METDTGANRTGQASGEQERTTNQSGPVLVARSLGAFERPKPGDRSEILKNRFLCRHGSLLLCGGTGLGKSSLAIQLPAQFALGRGEFGINPTGPLKSLIIQAENDDGDIAEFRDGAYAGYGYTRTEIQQIEKNVIVYTEINKRGIDFITQVAAPLLSQHKPDLIWLDHALAYYKGDGASQSEVGNFLRERVQPLLKTHDCACIILQHTPKPSDKRGAAWSDRDFSYLGFGSVEWANWARGVLTIIEVSDTIFELRAPKRGQRLGWQDSNGRKTCRRHIAWATDKIFWRTPAESELPAKKDNKPPIDTEDMFNFVLFAGAPGITWKNWWKAAAEDFGGTEKALRLVRAALTKDGRVHYEQKTRLWKIPGV